MNPLLDFGDSHPITPSIAGQRLTAAKRSAFEQGLLAVGIGRDVENADLLGRPWRAETAAFMFAEWQSPMVKLGEQFSKYARSADRRSYDAQASSR